MGDLGSVACATDASKAALAARMATKELSFMKPSRCYIVIGSNYCRLPTKATTDLSPANSGTV